MATTGFALVVGAGSGIGLETGLIFAEKGADGVVFADIDYTSAQAGAEKSRGIAAADDYKTFAMEVDVTDSGSVERMVQRAKAEFGRIDYFVNSAGIPRQQDNPITDVDIEEFDRLHDVNSKGTLLCLKEVLKVMKTQDEVFVNGRNGQRSIGRGSIVNVVSLSGLVGHPNSVTYTSSKFAANAISKTAAMEVRSLGIRVNSLCPGFTDTPMLQKGLAENPKLAKAIENSMPLKRVAFPEEVGEIAHFLAGPGASFVNGHVMVADAGVSLSAR